MQGPLLLALTLVCTLRLACLVCGMWYGPYMYAILPLGGLYLVLDLLAAYVAFANGGPTDPVGGSERVVKISWIAANVLALIGLLAAEIVFVVDLGFVSMVYDPVHISMWVMVLLLMVVIVLGMLLTAVSLRGRQKLPLNEYEYTKAPNGYGNGESNGYGGEESRNIEIEVEK